VVARADEHDLDPVGGGALERGLGGLQPLGHDPVAQVGPTPRSGRRPVQAVHGPALPGDRHGGARHAMLSRWLAGADRAEAGHGGGGEAGRQRLRLVHSDIEERRVLVVGLELLPTEPVEHGQADPVGRVQAEGVGEAGGVERGQ
jgi:hypothetical protein